MSPSQNAAGSTPALLDTVALLVDQPPAPLTRGSVGTVVDMLDGEELLVEFADDEGRAYAITPCATAELLVLRFSPTTT